MFILALFFSSWIHAQEVKAPPPSGVQFYRVKTLHCEDKERKVIALREFKWEGKSVRWIVDENTLKTDIVPVAQLQHCRPLLLTKNSPAYNDHTLASPYLLSLQKYNLFDGKLQNHGLTGAKDHSTGTYLTVDLCPSTKEFNKPFFELIKQKEWPVAIAVSGLWILKHSDDWRWLQQTLAHSPVTWVNHSRNHPVYPDVPLEKNYLLSEGRDVKKEILTNEILMIQKGLTPAIFFRFPGLVANENALAITQELGLIPLGSNAWLSKGEKPQAGSIVLVHGNGNEPRGIHLFMKDLEQKKLSEPFRELFDLFY